MGDRPQDQTPADRPGPRPARPRSGSSARPRPAGRSGTASRATTARTAGATRAAGTRAAGTGRAGGRPAARTARPTAAAAPSTATSPVTPAGRPPAGPRRPGRSGRERKAPSQNTMVVLLSILSVAAVGLVVYAFVLRPASTVGSGTGTQTTTTLDPAAPGTTLPDNAFTTFTSSTEFFSIRYPKEWEAVPVIEGQLDIDIADGDAVSVRWLFRTEVPTTAENVGNIKAFTDGIVGSDKSAKVLKVQEITVDGMPGYYYLYTFVDEETGAEGAHAQYFLFRGRNMYTIVFQTLPSEDFVALSRVFDQMAESFQTDPDTGPPRTASTIPAG